MSRKGLLPACCTDREGWAKRSYASEEEAVAAAVEAMERTRIPMQIYRCKVNEGRWHIRKARR